MSDLEAQIEKGEQVGTITLYNKKHTERCVITKFILLFFYNLWPNIFSKSGNTPIPSVLWGGNW